MDNTQILVLFYFGKIGQSVRTALQLIYEKPKSHLYIIIFFVFCSIGAMFIDAVFTIIQLKLPNN